MNHKVKQTIERHHMLVPGDTVLVALSGGADSMALLTVLYELKNEYSLSLKAAHFNHGIRGEEAMRDENFCVEVCRGMGVELFVGRADIPALAQQTGVGVEECGRRERYAFFAEVAPGAKVATAHTLSDCEETFLFNLARGSSLRGLTSIPPVRDNIIRPLIDCSRTEIEAYCEQKGIRYVTDSTNLSDEYTRNRIRHKIVPELKSLNPAFDSAFARCVEALREDEELLNTLSSAALERAAVPQGYLVEPISVLHSSLRRRAVAQIIFSLSGERAQAHHIDAVCSILSSGGDTQVCGGVSLRVAGGVLCKVAVDCGEWSVDAVQGVNKLPVGTVKITFCCEKSGKMLKNFNNMLLDNAINYDRINGKLIFSSIRQGDKIRLRGRGVTKPLRRIFNEMHVQPELRHSVPVLRDDEGVLWVYGVGVAERAAVDESVSNALVLSFEQ